MSPSVSSIWIAPNCRVPSLAQAIAPSRPRTTGRVLRQTSSGAAPSGVSGTRR